MSEEEKENEVQPLLDTTSLAFRRLSISHAMFSVRPITSLELPPGLLYYTVSGIAIQKHLNLGMAIVIMVGSVVGSAIFITPTAVLQGAGSVGVALIIWAICGMLNLLLALCYAELGSAIPMAGGDYVYIYNILGRFPAFMNLWIMVMLIGPTNMAFMCRTFGLYYSSLIMHDCTIELVIVCAVFLLVVVTMFNIYSMVWSSHGATWLSIGKVLGVGTIIVIGIVKICQGHTSNFHNIFAGTSTDITNIVGAFLPAFYTCTNWDCINALAEEMKNPRRDLPIAAFVSLLSITMIYLAINVAFFSVLSPAEIKNSQTIAMSFIQKAWPSAAWIIPVLVCLSCAGSSLSSMMACPRWAFAGGRDGNLPIVLSFMHIKYFTPVPAVVLTFMLSVFFTAATCLDLISIIRISSLQVQIKTLMALIALLRLRHKHPHLPRTIKVPLIVIVFALLSLLFIITSAVYQEPIINGISLLVFLMGAPIYLASLWLQKFKFTNKTMDAVTIFMQRLTLSVPEKRRS